MLQRLYGTIPAAIRVAGVHSLPITEEGSIVMVWDRHEQGLTTVGGRIDSGETIDAALDRETVEEAGLLLEAEHIPIAAWYWDSTDTYTVFVLAKVRAYVSMPEGFETTGRVTMNFETAKQLIARLEGEGMRSELIEISQGTYEQHFRSPV